jgi:hypothetical protein
LRIRKINDRISELHKENMQRNLITVDKILADLEHDKIMARKLHQYSVGKGCTELQGKYLSMFTDKQIIKDSDHRIEMDENMKAEAKRLSIIMLNEKYKTNPNLTNKVYTNVEPVLRQSVNQSPVAKWLQV